NTPLMFLPLTKTAGVVQKGKDVKEDGKTLNVVEAPTETGTTRMEIEAESRHIRRIIAESQIGLSRTVSTIQVEKETFNGDLPDSAFNFKAPHGPLLRAVRGNTSTTSVTIEKSSYCLTILSRNLPVKSYPVVFGRNPVDDKLREGDGCTPEGLFHLDARYPHRDWRRFMRLDY